MGCRCVPSGDEAEVVLGRDVKKEELRTTPHVARLRNGSMVETEVGERERGLRCLWEMRSRKRERVVMPVANHTAASVRAIIWLPAALYVVVVELCREY